MNVSLTACVFARLVASFLNEGRRICNYLLLEGFPLCAILRSGGLV